MPSLKLGAGLAVLLSSLCCTSWVVFGQSGHSSAEPDRHLPQFIVQLGHSSNLTALVVSADGRLAVTAGEDKIAILWDLASGIELRRFAGHAGKITGVAISKRNEFIATSSVDQTVIIWDAATAAIKHRLSSPAGEVNAVAISPDSKRVAAGLSQSRDAFQKALAGKRESQAVVWDAASGKELAQFAGPIGTVYALCFTLNSGQVFMGTSFHTASATSQMLLDQPLEGALLWNTDNGREVTRFIGHKDALRAVAISPDGRLALTGSGDKTAILWNIATGKEFRRFNHTSGVSAVSFSPDGRLVLTGTDYPERVLSLWQESTGKEIKRQDIKNQVLGAAFVREGRQILVTTGDSASLWDMTTSAISWWWLKGDQGAVDRVEFSPAGRFIKVEQFGKVHLWDTTNNQKPWTFDNESADRLAFAPDEASLLESYVNDGRLWDPATKRIVRTLPGAQVVLSGTVELNTNPIAFSRDGKFAVTGGDKNTVLLWDVVTGKELRRFHGHTKDIHDVSFSPDGKLLLSASWDQTARLWEVATGNMLRQFPLVGGCCAPALFAPDGKHVLIADNDQSVTLWDLDTGQQVKRFEHGYSLKANGEIAFSSDGRFLLLGKGGEGYSDQALLWNMRTQQESRSFKGRSPVAFSLDGRLAVTGDRDFVLHLWELDTGKELRQFKGHAGLLSSASFSPDGRFLISGSFDGTTRIWQIDTSVEICRLISFKNGDWVVATPDGRFDSNNLDQIGSLHWVLPDEPFTPLPLEIFMRDYYEPRLLPRLLKCNEEDNCDKEFQTIRDLTALNRTQPKVSIASITPQADAPEVANVTVEVANVANEFQRDAKGQPLQSGVYDVRLFRDGQLVGYQPATNGQVDLDASGKATLTFPVRLPRSGVKQVEFSAYAFNVDRVKSDTSRLTYELPATLKRQGGIAYVVSVGVNTNEQARWNLRYAANDARRVQNVLGQKLRELQSAGVYAGVVTVPLISDGDTKDATKRNFRAVLDLLAGRAVSEETRRQIPNADHLIRARPEDVVILSFAGHGYADATGAFYLVPYDTGVVTEGSGLESILDRCISSDELSEWLRDVDAGELTMIIDACHSAASVEGKEFKPGPMGSRGLGQLSYDKGMRILTATQADNVALELGQTKEGKKLEQGLLTYALIVDGIENKQADAIPEPDGRITLAEWLTYGVARVPQLYGEVKAGKRSLLESGQPVEGARTTELIGKDGKRGMSIQQPALFDFARRRAETELVDLRSKLPEQ